VVLAEVAVAAGVLVAEGLFPEMSSRLTSIWHKHRADSWRS
jgi:hypothetical protein